MTYEIEDGVPIPTVKTGPTKYPFADMEVGQSFVGERHAVNAAYQYGKFHGRKFKTRAEGEMYRIWRIS